MTSYIKDEGLMEYNAIWMNHMQTTGSLKHPHPDGVNQASGSLYARADDEALNQLIFPVPDDVVDPAQQHAIRQEQLTKLTKEVPSPLDVSFV